MAASASPLRAEGAPTLLDEYRDLESFGDAVQMLALKQSKQVLQ
jgi:hypothetical protein